LTTTVTAALIATVLPVSSTSAACELIDDAPANWNPPLESRTVPVPALMVADGDPL
jgi:hypothetical protein